jgi:hypothetical protein
MTDLCFTCVVTLFFEPAISCHGNSTDLLLFLGAFAKQLPKRLVASSCTSIRSSVRMEQLGCHRTAILEK